MGASQWFLHLSLLVNAYIIVPTRCQSLAQEFSSVDLNSVTVIRDGYSDSGSVNYFGLTVSLAEGVPQPAASGWVFIGAPKSNLSVEQGRLPYFEPGYIWRCKLDVQKQKCEILHFTNQVCEDRVDSKDRIDYGTCDSNFMGGSLALDNDVFVSCAPTWRRKKPNSALGLRMDGACYWMSKSVATADDLPQNLEQGLRTRYSQSDHGTLIPFQNRFFNNPAQVSVNGIPRWYFAESGFSVHVSRDRDILMGAPGVLGWSGSLIKLEGGSTYNNWGFTDVERYGEGNINYLNLFGYAVTSGYYLKRNEVLFAASSPRAVARLYESREAENILGAVLILRPQSLTEYVRYGSSRGKGWYHESVIVGEQFGAYFGASLESVDINGDGFDELLVGAPLMDTGEVGVDSMHSGDHGCIYIYTRQRMQGARVTFVKRICGNMAGGRFGTSIAKLGDLNQDGYNDFAVGIPYEENVGAVSIYYGDRDLNFQTVKISGKKYQPGMTASAFGFSVTGNVDLDGNGTPDFAVGDYLGKDVVVFRTRPKMEIMPRIYFYVSDRKQHPIILEKNATSFQIEICLSISIKSKKNNRLSHEGDIVIWLKLIIDDDEKRFTIGQSSTMETPFVIRKGSTRFCKDFSAERLNQPEDLIHDQNEVTVKYALWYNVTAEKESRTLVITKADGGQPEVLADGLSFVNFCSYCPNPMRYKEEVAEISFRKDCKRRGEPGNFPVCLPVLQVTLIGRYGDDGNPDRLVNQTEFVLGDTPWLAVLVAVKNVNQTAYSPIVQIEWKWENASDLASPQLEVSRSQCIPDIQNNSSAKCELDRIKTYLGKDQEKALDFRFNMVDVVAVKSASTRFLVDVLVYLQKDEQFLPVKKSFMINYLVRANLDHMEGALLNVTSVPTTSLYYSFKVNIGGSSPVRVVLKFLLPESIIFNGKKTKIFDIETPPELTCKDDTSTHREFKSYVNSLKRQRASEKLKLCEMTNCRSLTCNMTVSRYTRVLDLTFPLNHVDNELTKRILKKEGALDFYGYGHARALEQYNFTISRVILNPPEPKDIPAWIIIAAGVAALSALFLLVVCLCKCGFFKRSTKEKLALLKAEADAEDADTEVAIRNRYNDASSTVAALRT